MLHTHQCERHLTQNSLSKSSVIEAIEIPGIVHPTRARPGHAGCGFPMTPAIYLLRMMQPSSPIDDDIGLLVIEPDGSSNRPRSVELAEFEESVEHRAVFSDIEALKLGVIVLLKRKETDQPTGTVVQRLVTKLE